MLITCLCKIQLYLWRCIKPGDFYVWICGFILKRSDPNNNNMSLTVLGCNKILKMKKIHFPLFCWWHFFFITHVIHKVAFSSNATIAKTLSQVKVCLSPMHKLTMPWQIPMSIWLWYITETTCLSPVKFNTFSKQKNKHHFCQTS